MKMDKTLERHKLPKLTQEEVENLNRPIISREIELVIDRIPKRKAQLFNTSQILPKNKTGGNTS